MKAALAARKRAQQLEREALAAARKLAIRKLEAKRRQ